MYYLRDVIMVFISFLPLLSGQLRPANYLFNERNVTGSQPLLSSQFSRSRGWPLNRGPTVPPYSTPGAIPYPPHPQGLEVLKKDIHWEVSPRGPNPNFFINKKKLYLKIVAVRYALVGVVYGRVVL